MLDITPIMKIGFQDGLTHHLQQKKSKLEATVRVVEQKGKETSIDRIGKSEPVKKTTRYPTTPRVGTDFDRRWIMSDTWQWGDLIDDDDKLRLMGDPTSELAQSAQMGMQRTKDRVILAALPASVPAGEKSTDGSVAFPGTQIIAVGGTPTGLTFAKINLTREMLSEAQVPDDDPRYFVCTEQQITNLLDEPKATSADFVTIGAIQSGKFEGLYMGFNWIVLPAPMLSKTGQVRRNWAYTKSSVAMSKPKDVQSRIDQRPDLSYATQIYAEMRMGAARTEELGVVGVEVQERA